MDARAAVCFLQQRDLVRIEDVVDGDITIVDVSRRNRNLEIIRERGPSYLLKQSAGGTRVRLLAREAAVYQLLSSEPAASGFRRYLARFHGYDSGSDVLSLELHKGAVTLREYHASQGRFSTLLARVLGNALNALHSIRLDELSSDYTLTDDVPWVLGLHRPNRELLRDVSAANLEMIRVVQRFPAFGEMLDELRDGWTSEALIHRDIKWDNCIAYAAEGSNRRTRLKIIDWELAGIGDPCWDIGSVFNDYLSSWLLSIPVTGDAPPDQFLELATYPIERMQPALASFWRAYLRQQNMPSSSRETLLRRSLRYAAARLLQTAYEQMQVSQQLTGNTVCVLQFALNLMQRPREAAIRLLEIE